jgi:hypothetical protein
MGSESNEVDLNKLRDLVKRGQLAGNDSLIPTTQQVFVDKGKIVMGEDIAGHDRQALTRIDTETPFAGRRDDERAVVSRKFPPGTKLLVAEDVPGWLYDVTCELGTTYMFWTYFDEADGYYKTKVLEPHIEDFWRDPHRGHIFLSTNRLCLDTRYDGGAPTLERAYSRTVLWANGFSVARKTGTFPFSL